MRTKIQFVGNCTVELTYADVWGEREVRQFWIPTNGGYIRDDTNRQVCEMLSNRGHTLTAEGGDDLLRVVRREWARARRAERRRERVGYGHPERT